jgi:hypothetical protein
MGRSLHKETKVQKYIDFDRTRSHNCLFNFINGIRGCGKTYGKLKDDIDRYMKGKGRFIYLRRSEEELKTLTTQKSGRLFNHVQVEYEGHALWCEANLLHIDKEVCGYAAALSTARKLKSDALDYVTDIIFDEYVIDDTTSQQRYLPDEVTAFFEFYETVARPGSRDYDVTVWFLGNAISSSNPYFDFLNLDLPYGSDIIKKGEFLVQMCAPPDLIEAKKKTRFYQAIAGTEYAAYAVENRFLRDNRTFIEKKTKDAEYQFTLIYYDNLIGVWRDYRNCKFYISESVDKQCRTVYAVTTETQEPNTFLLRGFKNNYHLKELKKAYDSGCLFYESQKLYKWFRDIVRMGLR